MKMLRKNVDLPTETIAVLQIEATLSGFGSLKPFLEKILKDFATKSSKGRPEVYAKVLNQKMVGVHRKPLSKRVKQH